MKRIFLTFDVEEFDLPKEMGRNINEEDQFEIGRKGTEKLWNLLEKNNVKSTLFVSAVFAEKYPELIKKFSEKHEIGLHCYKHSDDYSKMKDEEAFRRLKKGKEIIEKITGKKIVSFRAPRLQHPSYKVLKNLEIKFDSSYNPTYVIGRYNNLFKTRKVHEKEGVTIIPISASKMGLPLFWIAFRNFPLIYSKEITKRNLSEYSIVCLIFHPWELVEEIGDYIKKMRFFSKLIIRKTGDKFEKKLDRYIKWSLKKGYNFETMENYLLNS